MGLSWQQGPLGNGPVGRFLTPDPLPQRLLFAEPLRRRMRVRFAGEWIADSEDVLLLHEPGHYPVAFFPVADVRAGILVAEHRTTRHRELGDTAWFTVTVGERTAARGAWRYTAPPEHAAELRDRVGFAWRAMDATTTSASAAAQPGATHRRGPKSLVSPTSSPSNRTRSTSTSTARSSPWSLGKPSSHTESTGI